MAVKYRKATEKEDKPKIDPNDNKIRNTRQFMQM